MVRRCARCQSVYEQGEKFCPLDGGVVVEGETAGDPLVGRILGGRYRLERLLGRGGMGVVYEAEHIGLGKKVAVKLLIDALSSDPEVLTRFHQEARAASLIGHENIIDILDIGAEEGRSYIAMELLRGHDLRAVCREVGPMPLGRATGILRQVCEALAAAHDKGIIHRDLKPENVFLVERAGRHDFVKLMDFGISKIKAAQDEQVRLTQTGAVIGTPLYMAPEQAAGARGVDHRVDVYSVGVMAHELIAGQTPFLGPTYLALVTQHLEVRPEPLRRVRPDTHPALEAAVLKALEKDPARRFQSMRDFMAALPDLDERTDAVAAAPTVRPPSLPARSPRRLLLALAAGVVVLGVVGVVLGRLAGQPRAAAGAGDAGVLAAPGKAVAAGTASLTIRSEPEGARVFVDGVDLGTTPVVVAASLGDHRIRVEHPGYVPIEMVKNLTGESAETLVLAGLPGTPDAGPRRPGVHVVRPVVHDAGPGHTTVIHVVPAEVDAGSRVSTPPPHNPPEPAQKPDAGRKRNPYQ